MIGKVVSNALMLDGGGIRWGLSLFYCCYSTTVLLESGASFANCSNKYFSINSLSINPLR